mmetsp:Transcript_13745/g.33260  ORF Transcript_13745/g.33260 Transcript_13745/m.33260 type:complete len:233 (-) Transcript_13745:1164-1862(-)
MATMPRPKSIGNPTSCSTPPYYWRRLIIALDTPRCRYRRRRRRYGWRSRAATGSASASRTAGWRWPALPWGTLESQGLMARTKPAAFTRAWAAWKEAARSAVCTVHSLRRWAAAARRRPHCAGAWRAPRSVGWLRWRPERPLSWRDKRRTVVTALGWTAVRRRTANTKEGSRRVETTRRYHRWPGTASVVLAARPAPLRRRPAIMDAIKGQFIMEVGQGGALWAPIGRPPRT